MKVHLTFQKEDFENLRAFEKAVEKQLGGNVYVGTNSLCVYFNFPKELAAMLRPYPATEQFEFDLDSSKPDRK